VGDKIAYRGDKNVKKMSVSRFAPKVFALTSL